MKWDPRSVIEYLPPPHVVVATASLESFHPRRHNCSVVNTELTQREVLHFIAATITVEEDGSKEEEEESGPKEGIETTTSPGGLPL